MTAVWNNAPRLRALGNPRASPGMYAVMDRHTGRPYLDMGFLLRDDAEALRTDLLMHYPAWSRWRRRLYVAEVSDQ